MKLTVVYITARAEPKVEWFLDSLARQVKFEDDIRPIIVDLYERPIPNAKRDYFHSFPLLKVVPIKPNIYQGKHRLFKEDWWAISTARNTGICLCETEWIAFCDDRCVLSAYWLDAVRAAQNHGYALAGSYEKWYGLQVVDGCIVGAEKCTTKDHRDNGIAGPRKIPGQWWFGCTSALPVEWALKINGFAESADSLGLEDNIFGTMLQANGYPICFDNRMKIIEDRTPYACEGLPKRTDKGVSPNDRSHDLLNRLKDLKRAKHSFEPEFDYDLRDVRNIVQSGGKFPIPTGPTKDWYDGQPWNEM